MIIYHKELTDGLSEAISASSSIAYASVASPANYKDSSISYDLKSLASFNDADLYYVQSILVSSSWNKNDDIFDKAEVWNARSTPEDKPTNLEHDENLIIGHITSNWPIDDMGNPISDTINPSELPDKFHILTGSVIYRAFTDVSLKERAEKLISEIENNSKYVSMECYFTGFDYGLINQKTNAYTVLARNNSTAYLTKYLRAYGGEGIHQEYKVGRVLRNITFSGKGFVDKPANPDSIIFTKDSILNLIDKKNDNLSESGVILNKSTSNAENIIMTENLEKQVAELGAKIDTVSSNCSDTVKAAYSLASELKDTNHVLEAAVKVKDEELKKAKSVKEEKEEELKKVKSAKEEKEEEMKKMKASFETEIESLAKKLNDEKAVMEEDAKKTKSELDAAYEIISAMKMKEEEMAKKEKKMKRVASLMEIGIHNDDAVATVDQFSSLDDDTFSAMTSLFAGKMPPWLKKNFEEKQKKEEEAVMKPMKKMASEESVSALDDVETEEVVALSVGGDDEESQADTIRAELVEFVSARLSKNSK